MVFKRILVPLDGSKLAESVIPLACSLAGQLQATLVFFHVVEKKAPAEIHGQHHLRDIAEAHAYLSALTDNLTCAGISSVLDVHEVQETGVAQTIRDHAQELNTDLVILCAHGSGGLRDVLFGSIAQQVIRQGTVPVLFIKPTPTENQQDQSIRQILVPLDGSASHEAAIPVAVAMAEKCEAKIHLLTVIATPETVPVKDALTRRVSPRLTMLSLESAVQHAEDYLKKVGKDISAKGIPVAGLVLRGDAPEQLLEAVRDEQIDLVVLATHSHSAIDAHWEGGLTPRFLPKTTVPVLLVQADEE
jgi:nucleotide-binding universal stress UspA family protein